MAKWGKADFRALKQLGENFEKAIKEQVVQQVIEKTLEDTGNRVLRLTKKRTPVGDYGTYMHTITRGKNKGKQVKKARKNSRGVTGGTLRKSWYLSDVKTNTHNVSIELYNPTDYASFVEYGHRKVNGRGWVEGRFMMTRSINEVQDRLPSIVKRHTRLLTQALFDDSM